MKAILVVCGLSLVVGLQVQHPEEAVLELKKELIRTLQTAVAEEGVVGAIDVCSLKAVPVTKEVSQRLDVALSRVTDRPRNPVNAANDAERELLEQMRTDLANESLRELYTLGEVAYSPLRIQPVCLNCHGSQLSEELQGALRKKYPDDQAVGYGLGDVRGAIKIAPAQ